MDSAGSPRGKPASDVNGAESQADVTAGAEVNPVSSTVAGCVPREAALTPGEGRFPVEGWKSLTNGRLQSAVFTSHTRMAYFLNMIAPDGRATCNFKAISSTHSKSLRLFKRGFIKKMELVARDGLVFYKARCVPEMRSSSPYKLKLAVETKLVDDCKAVKSVVFAECMPCPAGKAPRASCKHLAALMIGLEEFSFLGYTRDIPTCTDELQTWNRPHQKKSEPRLASEMDWGRKGKS